MKDHYRICRVTTANAWCYDGGRSHKGTAVTYVVDKAVFGWRGKIKSWERQRYEGFSDTVPVWYDEFATLEKAREYVHGRTQPPEPGPVVVSVEVVEQTR